jgi:hypothetical protein
MARPLLRQIGWFCALWFAGILTLGLVSMLIRAAIGS